MKLYLSVRGKGHAPTSRKQFMRPEFPCKMKVKLWGKIDVIGKQEIEVDCENPLMIDGVSKEIEIISENFFNDFNKKIDDFTLIYELEGKSSDAYRLKNSIPSFGYDVYVLNK